MVNHGNVVQRNEDGTIDHDQCNGYIHWIDSPTLWEDNQTSREDSPTSWEDSNGNTHYRW